MNRTKQSYFLHFFFKRSRTSIMSSVILSEFDNFQCILLGPNDKIPLKSFVGPAFALEPLNTHLGHEGRRASTNFINFVVDVFSDNGYCVAVKDTKTGNVVATLLILDFMDAHSTELEEYLQAECAVLSPIFHLIDMLHEKYFATRTKPTQRGQCLEVMATAVDPIYYNKGLLNVMCHHGLENIHKKHKEGIMILLEPTGAFSQAAGIKIGGVKVEEILYSEFEFEGTKPFEDVPKPHDRIALITLPSSIKAVARQ